MAWHKFRHDKSLCKSWHKSWQSFWHSFYRELTRLSGSRWDMGMLMLVPALVLVLFGAMFYHGKAHHLPVAIIDQDQGELSQSIIYHIEHNPALSVAILSSELIDAENAINRLHIGGYIHIPNGTQNRLVRGEDAKFTSLIIKPFLALAVARLQHCLPAPKTAPKPLPKNTYAPYCPTLLATCHTSKHRCCLTQT